MPEHYTRRIGRAILPDHCDPVVREVNDLLYDLGDTYERIGDDSGESAKHWKWCGDGLALLAALLAATAGIVGLVWDIRPITASFALAAATVSAVLTAVRPIGRASHAKSYADACWGVTSEVRDVLLIIGEMTADDARAALRHARARANEVSRQSIEIEPGAAW